MKLKKRFVTVVLCAVLVLLSVPTASAVPVMPDELFGYGHGSPSDPYVITSGEGLVAFRDLVNGGVSFEGKTVVLAADVSLRSLENKPIGTQEHPFDGVFDGQGYIAMGADGPGAMFGTVTGTVKNLTVSGTVTASGETVYAALLCERLYGTVENCAVQGRVTVTSATTAYAGGLCAFVFADGEILSSYSMASVEAKASLDAFVGGAFGVLCGSALECAALETTASGSATHLYLGAVAGSVYFGGMKHCFAASASPDGLVGAVYRPDGGLDNVEAPGEASGSSFAENCAVFDYVSSTCVAEGSCLLKCDACSMSKTVKLPAFGHVFTKKVMSAETVAALNPCTEESIYYYSCENCDKITQGATFASGEGLALHTPSGPLTSDGAETHSGHCALCDSAYTESHSWKYVKEDMGVVGTCSCGETRSLSEGLLIQESVSVKAGREVTVSFSLGNNPGVSTAKLILTYDRSVLTLKEVETVGFSSTVTSQTVDVYPYVILLASAGNVTDDGAVVRATFLVSESAPLGSIALNLAVADAVDASFDSVSLLPTVMEDGLRVVLPGDVNGDGKCNLSDVTRLMQYFAEWDVSVDGVAADVTGDGTVALSDVTRLMQYFADWDVTLQ